MQRSDAHAGSGKPRCLRLALALAALTASGPAWAQEAVEEKKNPRPPTVFDFDVRVDDPSNLLSPQRDIEDGWRRIWRQTGTRVHLYPSQLAGPDNWPPLGMYAGGWNYSVWRNPVTGWPEF